MSFARNERFLCVTGIIISDEDTWRIKMIKFDQTFRIGTKVKLDLDDLHVSNQCESEEWLTITEINEQRTLVKVKKYNLWITRKRISGYTNSEY
jgi:hypothetical protein